MSLKLSECSKCKWEMTRSEAFCGRCGTSNGNFSVETFKLLSGVSFETGKRLGCGNDHERTKAVYLANTRELAELTSGTPEEATEAAEEMAAIPDFCVLCGAKFDLRVKPQPQEGG